MKALFDHISACCSKLVTRTYSTSFSLGIRLLDRTLHEPIYGIYGFVRLADEIVDSFHDFPKEDLLSDFRAQTYRAIEQRISLNPILNSFQQVVHRYNIEHELIDTFLNSMEMDLKQSYYSRALYERYILGSAEVVGLMCLRVFCDEDDSLFNRLKHPAMKLGCAFQKVNFLRDIRSDTEVLGRVYFPEIDLTNFGQEEKQQIENEITTDFEEALIGIKQLPSTARKGVYLAYIYYLALFKKIKNIQPSKILSARIRVPNGHKISIMLQAMLTTSI